MFSLGKFFLDRLWGAKGQGVNVLFKDTYSSTIIFTKTQVYKLPANVNLHTFILTVHSICLKKKKLNLASQLLRTVMTCSRISRCLRKSKCILHFAFMAVGNWLLEWNRSEQDLCLIWVKLRSNGEGWNINTFKWNTLQITAAIGVCVAVFQHSQVTVTNFCPPTGCSLPIIPSLCQMDAPLLIANEPVAAAPPRLHTVTVADH